MMRLWHRFTRWITRRNAAASDDMPVITIKGTATAVGTPRNPRPLSGGASWRERLRKEILTPRPPGYRWSPNRRAAVVRAVRNGVVTLGEVQEVHGISFEEFADWCREAAVKPADEERAG